MKSILIYELKSWARRPLGYLFFASLWLLAFMATIIPQIHIGNSTGSNFINAPVIISKTILIIGSVGMLMIAAISSSSIIKDNETGFSKIYYSLPFSKLHYLLGKFLAAFCVLCLIFSAIPFAVFCASQMPWIDPSLIGEAQWTYYLQPIGLWMLPNLFFLGSLFFAMATFSRNVQLVFISGILCYALYLISYFSISRFHDFSVAAILDPFGILTEEYVTNYWTIEQQNTMLVPLQGAVLANRATYTLIGFILLLISYLKFKLADYGIRSSANSKQKLFRSWNTKAITLFDVIPILNHELFVVKQLMAKSFLEFRMTIANRFFLVILGTTVLILLLSNWFLYSRFGVSIERYTAAMIEAKEGPFPLFILLVLVVYAGDLIHRDQKHQFYGINDSLPIANWVLLGSKLMNLLYITALMFSTIIISGMIVQTLNGYFDFELGLYLIDSFFFSLPIYFFFAIIIFFLHVIAPNEYVGHALVLLFWVSRGALLSMGYEHHLLHFGRLPEHFYSEINGFFPFSTTTFWFFCYWACASLLLMTIAWKLWKRGDRTHLSQRVIQAKNTLNINWLTSIISLWIIIGGFIYHQIYRKNDSLTSAQKQELMSKKSTVYDELKSINQPIVSDVSLHAKHFPQARRHQLNLTYTLENTSADSIDSLIVNLPVKDAYTFRFEENQTQFKELSRDEQLGVYILKFNDPLPPNSSATLVMQLTYRVLGMNDLAFKHQFTAEQSFFSSKDLPKIGFEHKPHPTRYQLLLEVEKGYEVASSFVVKSAHASSQGIQQFELSGESATAIGWYILRSMESISYENGNQSGQVFYKKKYEHVAHQMLKTIKEVHKYMHLQGIDYPLPKLTLVQQARGFDKPISTQLGLIGIEETFGWFMQDLEPDDFDYFSYYFVRGVMKSYLLNRIGATEHAKHPFFVNAFAEYFAYDFTSTVNKPPLVYLNRRHNQYLSQRPKAKDDSSVKLEAPFNTIKGLFSLVGLSQHIGRKKFNHEFYQFVQQFNPTESDQKRMNTFLKRLQSISPDDAQYYIVQSLQESLFYDNRVESITSQNINNQYVNKVTIRIQPINKSDKNQPESFTIRLVNRAGRELKRLNQSFTAGTHQLEIITTERPEFIELDPFYTVIDLNRNNNRLVNY